jgi:ribosomal protein S18 acetylase RimI-like enzyme
MYVKQGSLQDSREIAKLYAAAFPDSIGLFFRKKAPDTLLDLLELAFSLLFHWGGEAVLIKDEAGSTHGYCMYSVQPNRSTSRRWGKILTVLGQMARRVALPELARLLQNQVLMTTSARCDSKTPSAKSGARILSIAINPVCQGQGVGTLLFTHVLETLQDHSVGLNVRADNPAARSLYAKAGFRQCGTTRDISGRWIMLTKEARERPPE